MVRSQLKATGFIGGLNVIKKSRITASGSGRNTLCRADQWAKIDSISWLQASLQLTKSGQNHLCSNANLITRDVGKSLQSRIINRYSPSSLQSDVRIA